MSNTRDFSAGSPRANHRLHAFIACLALTLGLSGAAQAECRFRAMPIPVEMVGTRAVATLGINGRQVRLVVDTGAFHSFLTHDAAQQLGLPERTAPRILRVDGLTGEVDAKVTTVKTLRFGIAELQNMDFMVGTIDPGAGAVGVLGRNLLGISNADTEYDLAHGVIRVMYPNVGCGGQDLAYWAGGQGVSELSMVQYSGQFEPGAMVVANINGHRAKALFDTSATTLVSLAQMHRADGKVGSSRPAGTLRIAGSGQAETWLAAAENFELGKETIANPAFRVADFDLDGVDMLLGIDFFLSHRIYVDNSQHRVFFTSDGTWESATGPAAVQALVAEAGVDAALTLQSSIDPNTRQPSVASPDR